MKPWQPVAGHERLDAIVPAALLIHDDDAAVVVDLKRMLGKLEGNAYEVNGRRHRVLSLTGWDQVGSLGPLLGLERARARLLPPLLWQGLAPHQRHPFWGLVPLRLRPRRPAMEFLGESRIAEHDVLEHALALERGVAWEPDGTARTSRNRIDDANHRVSAIRQAYGALRSDLVYRIEQSALFDPGEPTTAAFEQALAAFASHDGADASRYEDLASRVEVTFNVAVQHAERRGLRHIPSPNRADVRRAAKAARLASGAATEGERVASLTQVKRILDSLALYYLPSSTDEALAIDAPGRGSAR